MATAARPSATTEPGAAVRPGVESLRAGSLPLTRRLAVDLGRTSTATCRRGLLRR